MNVLPTEHLYPRLSSDSKETQIRAIIKPRLRRKNLQATMSTSTIEEPGHLDVLCGRGRGYFEHPGNRRMLSIIAQFKSEYQTASKVEKSKITQRVLQIVLAPEDGVRPRFLKRASSGGKSGKKGGNIDADGLWDELCEKEVHKKVAHTLREQKSIVKLSKLSIHESVQQQHLSPYIVTSEEEGGSSPAPSDDEDHQQAKNTPHIPKFVRLVSDESFGRQSKNSVYQQAASHRDNKNDKSSVLEWLDELESLEDFFEDDEVDESSPPSSDDAPRTSPVSDDDLSSSSQHALQYHRHHEIYRRNEQQYHKQVLGDVAARGAAAMAEEPLSFRQEPVFNAKEIDCFLLHTVLEDEEAAAVTGRDEKILLDSFFEDMLNNSYYNSLVSPSR